MTSSRFFPVVLPLAQHCLGPQELLQACFRGRPSSRLLETENVVVEEVCSVISQDVFLQGREAEYHPKQDLAFIVEEDVFGKLEHDVLQRLVIECGS